MNKVDVKKEGSSPAICLVLSWVQFLQRCSTAVVPVAEFLLCYLQPLAVIFIGMAYHVRFFGRYFLLRRQDTSFEWLLKDVGDFSK